MHIRVCVLRGHALQRFSHAGVVEEVTECLSRFLAWLRVRIVQDGVEHRWDQGDVLRAAHLSPHVGAHGCVR
ncbi:MAG TPA: hypothetical protein PKE00_14390, partial [Planctomycetota bacterium]|nr:hypothetical protein [Planctomycetota bacterium]